MSYDIVLASIPRMDYRGPYPAPFMLKAYLEQHDFKCKAVDWNRDLYDKTNNKNIFLKSDVIFNSQTKFLEYWEKELKTICSGWIDELKSYNSKWFGVSLVSQRNTNAAIKILEMVRKELPDIKIVVGGHMIKNLTSNIGENLKGRGLVDYFISGDGEESLLNLLRGNYDWPGINNNSGYKYVDLNQLPIADYSDLDCSDYKLFYTYTSRGCVNRCKFCSDAMYTKTFKYRDHRLIVKEIDYIFDKFGIRRYYFADCLINGNPKEFRSLIEALKGRNLRFDGMFLCNDWMTLQDWKNAADVGFKRLAPGFETGCDRIRKEMGKSFTNETIFKTMEYTLEAGIIIEPQMIIGWPTETDEEFQETLDFITKLSTYKNLGVVNAGATLYLDENFPAYHIYGVKIDENGEWYYGNNTFDLRRKRWFKFVQHCKDLNVLVDEKHIERIKGEIKDIV